MNIAAFGLVIAMVGCIQTATLNEESKPGASAAVQSEREESPITFVELSKTEFEERMKDRVIKPNIQCNDQNDCKTPTEKTLNGKVEISAADCLVRHPLGWSGNQTPDGTPVCVTSFNGWDEIPNGGGATYHGGQPAGVTKATHGSIAIDCRWGRLIAYSYCLFLDAPF